MSKFDKVIASITEQITLKPTVIKLGGTSSRENTRVNDTIKAIEQLGEVYGDAILIDNSVRVELKNTFGKLHIKFIYTEPEYRKQGLASSVLRQILDIADKNKVSVIIQPNSLDSSLETRELIKWYEKFGFVGNSYKMERTPE